MGRLTMTSIHDLTVVLSNSLIRRRLLDITFTAATNILITSSDREVDKTLSLKYPWQLLLMSAYG